MAKTAGYLRQYRAERRANLGRPLLDPNSPRMELGERAFTASLTPKFSDSIRPTGRAPRGKGPEFKARRYIANQLDTADRQIRTAERVLRTTRGQAKFRRRDTLARGRLPVLRQYRITVEKIARAPGSWKFKGDLIRDLRGSLPLLPYKP